MSGPPGGEKNIEGNRDEVGLHDSIPGTIATGAGSVALELKRNLRLTSRKLQLPAYRHASWRICLILCQGFA